MQDAAPSRLAAVVGAISFLWVLQQRPASTLQPAHDLECTAELRRVVELSDSRDWWIWLCKVLAWICFCLVVALVLLLALLAGGCGACLYSCRRALGRSPAAIEGEIAEIRARSLSRARRSIEDAARRFNQGAEGVREVPRVQHVAHAHLA